MHRFGLFAAVICVCALASGCSGLQDKANSQSGGGSVSITVSPTSGNVVVSQTFTFQATVTGSSNTAANWLVNNVAGGNNSVGTITASGTYTAPAAVPSPANVTVTAVAQADTTKSASASIQILQSNPNQNAQSTPIKLGTSGGNSHDSSVQGQVISCCSGTLGSLVQRNGTQYILSNNHVLARSDIATIGDPITQPGLIDANCAVAGTITVANLSQFVNLETSGANVDAALAQVVSGAVDSTGSILSLGSTATGNTADPGPPHAGTGIAATIGEGVAKSGRSSGLTCSTVGAISVTATVSYQKGCGTGSTYNVQYTNQVSVSGGAFSGEGDSGSLIVDRNTADPVALLYAGSDTDAVGNPVADVLSALADSQGNKPTFVGTASTHAVIGCTLASNAVKIQAAELPALQESAITLAEHARDLHAAELLATPYIQAIGVAPSIDHPGEAAVLIVVNPGQKPTPIPATLEGVRTRIIEAGAGGPRGTLQAAAASKVAPVSDASAVNALSSQELQRAKTVHTNHVKDLMKQPGVQGVGITSSGDAPGEAALMIYLVRGAKQMSVPQAIDGLRTRVRESSPFTAGRRRGEPASAGCRVPKVASAAAAAF
jgi:hypothetical protein